MYNFCFFKNKDTIKYFLLFIIVLLQVMLMWHLKQIKPDLFLDEYYTFNFSNSNYTPILYGEFNNFGYWLNSDFWHKMVTVQIGEQFNYGAVYYNTAKDVHPPVYYFLVHTVYSFFPDVWNPDLVLAVNMLIFFCVQFLLYHIGISLFKDKTWALANCLVYGFSIGAINAFTFIRMYGLLIFWVLLHFLLCLKFIEEYKKKYLLRMIVINVLGFLTHYHFIIYSFSIFMLLVYLLKSENRLTEIRDVFFLNLSSLLISIALFTPCLEHILGKGSNSYRGQEAFSGILGPVYTKYLARDIFLFLLNNPIIVIFFLFVLVVGAIAVINNKQEESSVNSSLNKCNLVVNVFTVSVLFIFVVISRTAPFIEMRYFYLLFPLISIIIFYDIKKRFAEIKFRKYLYVCICSICLVIQFYSIYCFKGMVPFLVGDSLTGNITQEWLNNENVHKCVVVTNKSGAWYILYTMNVLMKVDKTCIIEHKDTLENIEKDKRMLFLLEGDYTRDKAAKLLEERYGYRLLEFSSCSRINESAVCLAEAL